jgi:hypothetical protein
MMRNALNRFDEMLGGMPTASWPRQGPQTIAQGFSPGDRGGKKTNPSPVRGDRAISEKTLCRPLRGLRVRGVSGVPRAEALGYCLAPSDEGFGRGHLRVGIAIIAAMFLVATAPRLAWADGGTVRLSEVVGPYRITAFTSPNPFRAGPVDVSVLVQDARTGDAVPDAEVTLHLSPREEPDDTFDYRATAGTTTNKLFHSAMFELPAAGEWNVAIDVAAATGKAHAIFDVAAADRLPRWVSFWPWFSWPLAVIALYVIHQALTAKAPLRRGRAPAV